QAIRAFIGVRYDSVKVPFIPLDVTDQAVLQNGPLEAINFRLTHNTRDFDLEPAAGGYEVFTADIGRADLKPLNTTTAPARNTVFGIVNFTKFGIDSRRYFSTKGKRITPKDVRTVIALRLMAGSSAGTMPFAEQYFVGGAESLRGFNEDRFWGKNMFLAS